MYLHNFGQSVVAHAPAKLNLFLEVLARRADGYHDLETLMTAVDLFDTLRFVPRDDGAPLDLDCRWGEGYQATGNACNGDLPTGRKNIVIRALEHFREVAGVKRGASVEAQSCQ